LIRRLYKVDASGIRDIELLDEAGYALLVRSESIIVCTRAHAGMATCPRCKAAIAHDWGKLTPIECACGWATTWGEYHASYRRRQLHGGAAFPAFERFAVEWPRARSPEAKMLLIDALLHACHVDVRLGATRSAAVNLIEGTTTEILVLLDELAYGDLSTPGTRETRLAWRDEVASGIWGWRNRRTRGLPE
jgi:hypothetical protein